MLRTISVRLLIAGATMAAVSAIVFFGTWALPVDPVAASLGNQASPALIRAYRHSLGLDRPVGQQYVDWLSGFVHGSLGKSVPRGTPVWSAISDRVRNTAFLALATLVILIPLGLALGIFSAVRRDSVVDHGIAVTTLTAIATPEFVVGTFVTLALAVWTHILPPLSLVDSSKSIFSQLSALVLPVITLLTILVAQMTRMVRATMIDVLNSEYVRIAVLKGVSRRRILLRHALPNAIAPTLQIIAFTIGWLVGGVVIVENVFQYPGLGTTVTSAILTGDLATVEAIVMMMTAVYLGATFAADITAILIDPKLRHRRR